MKSLKKMLHQFLKCVAVIAFLLNATSSYSALTDLASGPFVNSGSATVKPNLIFIMDDSGSMDWSYLPDWANDTDPFLMTSYLNIPELNRNAGFNSIAYNPAITYLPPNYYNADGTANTTAYPSMTAANTTNWTAVKNDGYGVQDTGTSNLVSNAYFYTFIPGEYCTSDKLRVCNTQTAPTTSYPYPAGLRWCNSSNLTTCQALWYSGTYTYPRYPKQATATITISGSSSTSVSGITVNGKQIMNAGAGATTSYETLAASIVNAINSCTASATGSCTVSGHKATYYSTTSGTDRSVITIYAPAYNMSGYTHTPSVTQSGSMTISTTAFANQVPGSALLTNIVSTTTSYPYPNTTTKASTRTDCAGTTCTYAEEMTNYANWWAYYRTRMQMMKSSASIAFSSLNANYRIGYASLNNNNSGSATKASLDFLNIDDFETSHKKTWYDSLFAADPDNGTALRAILSKAGRMYAGKLSSWNGVTVTDPIEYSCQQNFTLLSTDGYWNGSAGYKIDGSSSIGNQDAFEPRPFNDGGSVTFQKSTSQIQQSQTQLNKTTSQLQKRTEQLQSSTSNLQRQVSQLQTRTSQLQASYSYLQAITYTLQRQTTQLQRRTSSLQRSIGQLQTRTSSNSGSTWGSWSNTSECKWDRTGSSRRDCQYVWGTYSNVSSCNRDYETDTSHNTTWSGNGTECQYTSFGAWTGVSSCSPQAQDTSDPYSVGTAVECQSAVTSAYADTSSCTATTSPDGSGNTTQCRYVASSPTNVSSCTAVAQSTGPTYTTGTATSCQYSAYTTPTNVSSCTPVSQDTSSPHTVGTAVNCSYGNATGWAGTASCNPTDTSTFSSSTATECQTAITTPYTNVSSCTSSTTPDASGYTVACQYTAYSAYANASSCVPTPQSTASPYTVGTAIQCQTTDTGWVGTGSCTASASGGQVVSCQTVTTGPTPVASCTAATANSGNSFTQTTCNTTTISSATPVASCTSVSPTAGNNYVSTNCNTVTTGPTTVSSCTAASASASNSYTTTTCSAPSSTGGYSNTLADVAEYYYITDLRTSALSNCTSGTTGETLCSASNPDTYNNVPTSGLDGNSAQHMTTFTLGLGIPGYMQFSSSYASATSGDFYDVKVGSLANPSEGICPWQSSGACNWPEPSSDSQANIDDLWHAGVNGRGTYFSAGNPALLITGISNALAGITTRTGTAAAATTSNPNVSSGDNFIFSSTFTTQGWYGELTMKEMDVSSLTISDEVKWSAQTLLDSKTYTTRNIYTFDAGGTNKLKTFVWSNLTSTEQAYFQSPYITTLSQFCTSGVTCLSTTAQTNASGQNLVNYLRGDRSNEGDLTDTAKYYRQRAHVLGDIVSSQAAYVGPPRFSYADLGYSSYKSTQASRRGMVYVSANDGMLHAFNAVNSTGITGGEEAWAYIPSLMLPKMYKLADKNYANLHEYFTDGTPVTADVCTSLCSTSSAVWKTILVAGFNGGARGYYALDVTDPSSPKALWEFTDTNLGYSFSNPRITKLKDGTWVVIVTSGYNNVSPGDGVGRLYVLNAATGALISSINSGSTPGIISTGYGNTTSPSGLGKLAARVSDPSTDNTVTDVYAGDMYGNLWRFDVNNDVGAAGYDAHLLAILKDGDGTRQPITSKPTLGKINEIKVVLVGTGSMLGNTDLTNTQRQTFYAIKDNGDTVTFDSPRVSSNNFVQQTLTTTTCPSGSSSGVCTAGQIVRTGSQNDVDFATQNGWYLDLADTGERANTDPSLDLGTISFSTNVPNSSACTLGGYGYLYYLDYKTGKPITNSKDVVSVRISDSFVTSVVVVSNVGSSEAGGGGSGGSGGSGSGTQKVCITTATGQIICNDLLTNSGGSATRRTSWRELIIEE